jgi:hypothetical protein
MSLSGFYGGLTTATIYSFGACVVSLPLLIFRPVRPIIAVTIQYLSYMWGLYIWIAAFGYLLSNWGWLPVIIGLFLAGVGVAPVAIFMALIHGKFGDFFYFLIAVLVLFGARYLAHRLVGLHPSDAN